MEMVTCKVIPLSAFFTVKVTWLESLKSAAAIYLVFLCCQPLFFPPENILSVVYEPSLFLSQIPNALFRAAHFLSERAVLNLYLD